MVVSTPWGGNVEDFGEYGPIFQFLVTFSSALSIAGSLTVIIAFVAFKQLRRFFARLVVFLAISDLWMCSSFLLGQARAPHYTRCYVQSALGTFFGLASILWTVVIADALRRVLLAQDLSVESKYEARVHIFAWGAPLLATLVCAVTRVFGPAGMTCWIRNTALGTIVRLVVFYLPLWAAIAYCLWVYWYVRNLMKLLLVRQSVDASPETEANVFEYQKEIQRQHRSLQCLMMLPLILVFCWTPSSIRRLIDIFIPTVEWSWAPLDYLCVFVGPLQGFLNAVVYGATPAVRDAMTGRLDHSARMLRSVQQRLKAVKKTGKRRFDRLREGGTSLSQNGDARGASHVTRQALGSLGSTQSASIGHSQEMRYHDDQLLDDLDGTWDMPDLESESGPSAGSDASSATAHNVEQQALRATGDSRTNGDLPVPPSSDKPAAPPPPEPRQPKPPPPPPRPAPLSDLLGEG